MAYNPDAGLSHVQVYPDGPARVDQNYTFATIPLHTSLNAFEDLTFAKDTDLTDGSIDAIFDTVAAMNNGNGINFKVGDDAWLGDVNCVNTVQVSGQQNPTAGHIRFGSGSLQPTIGHNGNGGFPAIGQPQAVTGSILSRGAHLYFFNGTSSNNGWAQII